MKSVIKKQYVRTLPEGAERTAHPELGGAASEERTCPVPGVRLVRIDGRVSAIEFTCRCGDVSVLELEYADAGSATEDPR